MFESLFLSTFELKTPLIQAGMGGVSGVELAASVSNQGCLGVLAQYKNSPQEVIRTIQETRHKTACFIGVNFIPEVSGTSLLDKQIEALIQCGDNKLTIVMYGLPPKHVAEKIISSSIPLIIQVGTQKDAEAAYLMGATCIVLQGIQAGGHLLGEVTTEELLKDVLSCKFEVPLIVAGGISSGIDYLYYRDQGASGCMCGTMFVTSHESNAHPKYKQLIVDSAAKDTIMTDLFHIGWEGRIHRVLKNETVRIGQEQSITFIAESEIFGKRYPVPRFSSAAPLKQTNGAIELMALYCGESCENIQRIEPVEAILERFCSEIILHE
ncbi:NAD(P)H-dependent flavin oxidoreductase [Paenibacillus sp. TSA_86.1]|uniref:NAD(P)H-dependent flavin oxidoreductase n=1 Tax=Paenibacillus sp. TSA_86.1 TaxID=3415649 RepID=UPI0040467FC7